MLHLSCWCIKPTTLSLYCLLKAKFLILGMSVSAYGYRSLQVRYFVGENSVLKLPQNGAFPMLFLLTLYLALLTLL